MSIVYRSDGRTEENPPGHPLEFQGPLPDYTCDDAKMYTGGCHCGAIRLAVKTPPLPRVEVKEDNCSICVRVSLQSLLRWVDDDPMDRWMGW